MKKLFLLIVVFSVLIGCSSKQPNIFSLNGAQINGVISMDYESMRGALTKAIMSGKEDEPARQYLQNNIDGFIAQQEQLLTCNYMLEQFAASIDNEMKVVITDAIEYRSTFNLAISADVRPGIYRSMEKTGSADAMTYSYITELIWPMGTTSVSGKVIVDLALNTQCSANKDLAYSIAIPRYGIVDPYTPLGQHIAEIIVDESKLISAVNNIKRDESIFKLAGATQEFQRNARSQLLNRYQSSTISIKNEQTYAVSSDIVVSRVQRKLEHYKYDSDHTLFKFIDTAYIPCENASNVNFGDYQGRACSFPVVSTITLFPESGGRTSAIFKVDYPIITDTFADGKVLTTESGANEYMKNLIGNFSKIITQ